MRRKWSIFVNSDPLRVGATLAVTRFAGWFHTTGDRKGRFYAKYL